jgi:hypothetical protein
LETGREKGNGGSTEEDFSEAMHALIDLLAFISLRVYADNTASGRRFSTTIFEQRQYCFPVEGTHEIVSSRIS